jgi:hypothetical protein
MLIRVFALAALIALPLFAQEAGPLDRAARLIAEEGLKKHLMVLASDEYEGRCAGFPGNDKAAEYIANHFRKIGLVPVGDKDDKGKATYFQEFKVRGRATRNCVGFVEGTDAALKGEIVVIGAHHDHVGKEGQPSAGRMKNRKADPEDTIWNGADDNGSGTVTVLEIARGFMEGKLRAKRSILFMTFSGEEWGLLGSAHYVENPIFPLSKTSAMINLDMVGRNPAKPMDVGGVSTAKEWVDLAAKAAEGTGLAHKTSAFVMPGSDHYSFARKRIPAVHFFTGFHEDYHCQSDHADKIDFANMEKIGRFGLRLLVSVADLEQRMAYTGASGARRLGIETEELSRERATELGLAAAEGGIAITDVREDSIAVKAGIREGDILVEFNGKKLPADDPVGTLRSELRAVKDDTDVPLVVIREGKRVSLSAKWPGETF